MQQFIHCTSDSRLLPTNLTRNSRNKKINKIKIFFRLNIGNFVPNPSSSQLPNKQHYQSYEYSTKINLHYWSKYNQIRYTPTHDGGSLLPSMHDWTRKLSVLSPRIILQSTLLNTWIINNRYVEIGYFFSWYGSIINGSIRR